MVVARVQNAVRKLRARRLAVSVAALVLVTPFLAALVARPAVAAPGLSAGALRESPLVRLGSAGPSASSRPD
jgi:hypothetical protein